MNLVILTEEPSMAIVLESLLPRIFKDGHTFQIIHHRGISDLRTSLPRKLKGWKAPNTKFLILVDQDSADCKKRKTDFEEICVKYKSQEDFSVRIVCRELESWFLGDVEAILQSGLEGAKRLVQHASKDICTDPDSVIKPSGRLSEIIGGYQKIGGAKAISPHIVLERNTSRSFVKFVEKVREFCQA